MDTVQIVEGWESDPFAGRVEDGKLYGQGACDMKGGLAASMMAFDAVARSEDVDGEVLFTAVVDEEGPYGLGTDRLLRDGYVDECDMAIVPEPGPLLAQEPVEHPAIMLGARGRVLVEVTVHGEAAHGSRPERGTNAVVAASKIATAVEERLPVGSHPALGAGSVCPLLLEGGSETLSVPETARLLVDRHIVVGETQSQVLADFEALVESLDLEVDVDIGLRESPEADMEYGPYVTDRDHPLVTALSDATRSTTGQAPDFGYFSSVGDFNYLGHRAGLPTAILGPDGGNIHSAEEFVYTEDVVDVARILADGLYRVLR
jgi:succinyl-diaminopimelate desuccinylase